MGMNIIGSSSSYEEPKPQSRFFNAELPNPNPMNYSIIRSETVNNKLVIEIVYPDCINYEGRKIMLYECTLEDLISQKSIDPHFCNNDKFFSPFARFEPTEKGWYYAITLANII